MHKELQPGQLTLRDIPDHMVPCSTRKKKQAITTERRDIGSDGLAFPSGQDGAPVPSQGMGKQFFALLVCKVPVLSVKLWFIGFISTHDFGHFSLLVLLPVPLHGAELPTEVNPWHYLHHNQDFPYSYFRGFYSVSIFQQLSDNPAVTSRGKKGAVKIQFNLKFYFLHL